MDFDRSWWTIRSKLDAYLDAADVQGNAFGDALRALDDYTTKCANGLRDMNKVHHRAQLADDAAYNQLRETWYAVIEELGVIASRMTDTSALYELSRFDIRSADAEMKANRSTICSGTEAGKEVAE